MEFGVRLNNRAYFKFYINLDDENIDVKGEIIMNDGTVIEHEGSVVWEEGE